MEALQYSVKTKFSLAVQGVHIPGYVSYTLIFANQAIEDVTRYKVERELEFDSTTIHTVQTMLCK